MQQHFLRILYFILSIGIICLGLLIRKMSIYLPDILNLYLGDILWAMMVFFLVRMLFPRSSTKKVALLSLAFCFSIELSQLYQAEWINMIRKTTLGGLVLGFGFLWSDLLAYILGICAGIILNSFLDSVIIYRLSSFPEQDNKSQDEQGSQPK